MTSDVMPEGLSTKKPLHKMHEQELRHFVMEEFPMITSASTMNKDDLISALYDVTGFEETPAPSKPHKDEVADIKKQLAFIKAQLKAEKDVETRERLKKRFKHLKKLSRKLTASV